MPIVSQHSIELLMGFAAPNDPIVREIPVIPATPVVPLVIDSVLVQVSTLAFEIVPSFDSFLNFSLDDLILEVLFPPKSNWQTIESASVWFIRTNLFKIVEAMFYETLVNCVDSVMTFEHIPSEALIDMLLFSMSSATNLIGLEESNPLRALIVDFLLASHDWKNSLCNLLSIKLEAEFQCLKDEFEGTSQVLLKEKDVVARSLEEARSLDYGLFSDARMVDLGLVQHTRNLTDLKKALEELMEEIRASELKIKKLSTQCLGIEKRLQQCQELVA